MPIINVLISEKFLFIFGFAVLLITLLTLSLQKKIKQSEKEQEIIKKMTDKERLIYDQNKKLLQNKSTNTGLLAIIAAILFFKK